MVGHPSLHHLLDEELDWELFLREPSPSINEFHKGCRVDRQKEGEDDGNLKDPPEVCVCVCACVLTCLPARGGRFQY
jgi:hypothetical protein